MVKVDEPLELKGVLVSQRWGMMGISGKAAKLYLSDSKLSLNNQIPFGELIIGGDKFNETIIQNREEYINDFFKTLSPVELGKTSFCDFGREVPFNLKVLSVREATPLTCNPDEKMACLFNSQNVKVFRSPISKSQLVIALSNFLMFVGFRSFAYIVEVFKRVPEMQYLVDKKLLENFLQTENESDFLKLFANILDALPSQVEMAGRKLSDRLIKSAPSYVGCFHPKKLFLELISVYPNDAGAFLPYFLNFVKLNPLEALTLEPGIPYTYMFGDAFECSNTVVNETKAAFSTRKDLSQFIESLHLRFMSIDQIKEEFYVSTRSMNSDIVEYMTHCPSFRVFRGLLCSDTELVLPQLKSFSILLIIEGEGRINNQRDFIAGSTFLFFAEEVITLTVEEKGFFMQVGVNFV